MTAASRTHTRLEMRPESTHTQLVGLQGTISGGSNTHTPPETSLAVQQALSEGLWVIIPRSITSQIPTGTPQRAEPIPESVAVAAPASPGLRQSSSSPACPP